jgi:NAD(P)-dependent dehydrogenase (short-subunit alcohol dehydrogenase family)
MDLFDRVIAVNLGGAMRVMAQAAAAMAAAAPLEPDGERGVVVNTASIAAFEGQIGQAAYAASKGAVAALTLPAARDLAKHGVRVAAIAPGLFGTPMLRGLPEEVQASLAAQVPYPARLGDPAEFAATVLFVVASPYLNGSVIRLDGALRMGPK